VVGGWWVVEYWFGGERTGLYIYLGKVTSDDGHVLIRMSVTRITNAFSRPPVFISHSPSLVEK